ncbi:MAG: oxidoreductase, partial [Planctomycetia bacterium]|nr:oxidoreductase [Planctomycetia bacterium]
MSEPKRNPSAATPVEGGAHVCPSDTQHDRESPEVDLFCPLTIRGVTLRNRVVMSP